MTRRATHVRGARARRLATGLLASGGPGPGFYSAAAVAYEGSTADRADVAVDDDIDDDSVGDTLARCEVLPESLGKKYAFKLSLIRSKCPWYDQAFAVWSRRLGASKSAEYAIACRLNDTEISTMNNYRGKWKLFLSFCVGDGLQPLPASP